MKKSLLSIFLLVFVVPLFFSISSCASMINGSTEKFSFYTSSGPSFITIKDAKKSITYQGKTPVSIVLKRGLSYGKGQDYQITIVKPSDNESVIFYLHTQLNNWYIYGNLFLGFLGGLAWILGYPVIDPLSGAMYDFYLGPTNPKEIHLENGVISITWPKDRLALQEKAASLKSKNKYFVLPSATTITHINKNINEKTIPCNSFYVDSTGKIKFKACSDNNLKTYNPSKIKPAKEQKKASPSNQAQATEQ